ncbi:hypothetical protein VPH35_016970 [Triticum aestivum]|uniref:Uncharacterized protein n=1 Tax=Aegilops tauschii TaxID=37682 RepID=N1QW02_AEGTA
MALAGSNAHPTVLVLFLVLTMMMPSSPPSRCHALRIWSCINAAVQPCRVVTCMAECEARGAAGPISLSRCNHTVHPEQCCCRNV